MAFALGSYIEIGKFKNVKPHEVNVKKSIFEYVDRATIKVPITARIVRAGEVITASVETAKQFEEGNTVLIKLCYNGNFKTEFEGFISRINFTSPLEIECEGYSYVLRKNTYLKTFVNAQLLDILKYLIAGTEIVLDTKNIPGFRIDKLVLNKVSGTEALEMIKQISKNTIRFFFTGNLLYAGLQYNKVKADVKYKLGWNVIKDGNLKQRQAKNQDVTVNFIGEKKDGTKVNVVVNGKKPKNNVVTTVGSAGTTGETLVIKTHGITDEAALKQMADAKLKQLSFDGYEGKITAFGIPYCEPGYGVLLTDDKYQERSGHYIIESTEVSYGMSGFRRTVGIGSKL